MDHNLEESHIMEGAIGSEANTEECVIDLNAEVGTGMEFEEIVEQPMFMDTESEEVIVPDFGEGQYSIEEYSVADDSHKSFTNTVVETKATETKMEYENLTTITSTANQPKIISVKLQPKVATQHVEGTTKVVPRQVAIAPKPTRIVAPALGSNRQFLITQKPKESLIKKTIAGVVQAPPRGNFVSVMPKIKLVSSVGQNMQYAQLIKQPPSSFNKQGVTKLVIQGSKPKEPSSAAVITKVVSQPTRIVTMQQKTVPISISNEMAESPKAKIKLAKVQQISLKSPRTTPANSGVGHTLSKKLVVTSQPSISKPVLNLTKEKQEGTIRMHPIHVPGKGVQYIQVLTKPSPMPSNKPVVVIADPKYKGYVNKNKIVQIGGKVISAPPPLVYTSTSGTTVSTSVSEKIPQKFVRIAPLGSKTAQAFLQKARPSQSLLAPLSPTVTKTPETAAELLSAIKMEQTESKNEEQPELVDPNEALRALVADAVGEEIDEIPKINKFEDDYEVHTEETVIEEMTTEHDFSTTQDFNESNCNVSQNSTNQDYNKQDYIDENNYSTQSDINTSQTEGRNTPLIVIPSTFVKRIDDSQLLEEMPVHVRMENYSDYEVPNADLLLRPQRRGCRCTKSQCLKLYCDCFANGEFCNQCNCINCHNNLANEELRQKAIRGCLDRNPNAFRPKIGKAKSSGIDIIRRHITGCHCKRSGCLKNYCECFEAKIACSGMCKCVGCRNVEEALPRRHMNRVQTLMPRPPCSFMTNEVIEAVCQCLIAAAKDSDTPEVSPPHDPIRNVIEEFSRCLQDIIGAAHHPEPNTSILDEIGG